MSSHSADVDVRGGERQVGRQRGHLDGGLSTHAVHVVEQLTRCGVEDQVIVRIRRGRHPRPAAQHACAQARLVQPEAREDAAVELQMVRAHRVVADTVHVGHVGRQAVEHEGVAAAAAHQAVRTQTADQRVVAPSTEAQ